jgi:hypothetical protein
MWVLVVPPLISLDIVDLASMPTLPLDVVVSASMPLRAMVLALMPKVTQL